MAHYVKEMVNASLKLLDNDDKAFMVVARFKRALDRGDYVLNHGKIGEISAKDLLWQDYWHYDQIGHTYLTLLLWAVVCHPGLYRLFSKLEGLPDLTVLQNTITLS